MNFNKNDYKILVSLFQGGCINTLKAFSINTIKEKTNLSDQKIRKTLHKAKGVGWVEEGSRNERWKTYFVTQKFIEHFKSLN